jgi:lysyl-tRNA synthetase class 2
MADAFGAVGLRFPGSAPEPPTLSPGDLLVVEARRRRGHLELCRIVEHHPEPLPDARGEFARLAWDGTGRLLEARAAAFREIRRYFATEGFLEIDTPVRVLVPGSDPHVTALSVSPPQGGWLITSPEHHMKRLLTGGVPRLFQLARASRAEELGPWHEPEFVLLEWYRAFAEPEQVMRDTERVMCRVFDSLEGHRPKRLARRFEAPFERIAVADAFARWASVRDVFALASGDEARYFELFVGRVEPELARLPRPVFLVDFPLTHAALARASPREPRAADRFELYFRGVELCNGYGELTDPDELVRRHTVETERRAAAGEPVYPLDERLVAALREGMPPASGNALGVDRLIALSCNRTDIAATLPFPAQRL